MLDNCLTKEVRLSSKLTTNFMHEEYTTVREFLRNYKKFVEKDKTVIITKNGKPEGVFTPFHLAFKEKSKKGEKINLKDLEKYQFSSGIKNLSEQIDEIVYGAPNPHRNDPD